MIETETATKDTDHGLGIEMQAAEADIRTIGTESMTEDEAGGGTKDEIEVTSEVTETAMHASQGVVGEIMVEIGRGTGREEEKSLHLEGLEIENVVAVHVVSERSEMKTGMFQRGSYPRSETCVILDEQLPHQ